MIEALSPLISSLCAYYLPIDDISVRMTISMAITGISIQLLKYIVTNLQILVDYFSWLFPCTNYLEINAGHYLSPKLFEIVAKKFDTKIVGCQLTQELKLAIKKMKTPYVIDNYKGHEIRISINKSISKNNNDGDDNDSFNFLVSGECSMEVLKGYIIHLTKQINNDTNNGIEIHHVQITGSKKEEKHEWMCNYTLTNKNIFNTIVSDHVNKEFYQNISKFLENPGYYNNRGIPYKQGYILHGPPGTGKTSLIKAVANEFKLPIFVLDLSLYKSNRELTAVVNKIKNYIGPGKRYIVAIEDIDTSEILNHKGKYNINSLLNILDGIDENTGRITVITLNNFSMIKNLHALIRPGRIDTIVEVDYCDAEQTKKIIDLFYPDQEIPDIDSKVKISSANLIKLLRAFSDVTKVVKTLNNNQNICSQNVDIVTLKDGSENNDGEQTPTIKLETPKMCNSRSMRKIYTSNSNNQVAMLNRLKFKCHVNAITLEARKKKMELQIEIDKINALIKEKNIRGTKFIKSKKTVVKNHEIEDAMKGIVKQKGGELERQKSELQKEMSQLTTFIGTRQSSAGYLCERKYRHKILSDEFIESNSLTENNEKDELQDESKDDPQVESEDEPQVESDEEDN